MPLPGEIATVLASTPVQTANVSAHHGDYVRTDTDDGGR